MKSFIKHKLTNVIIFSFIASCSFGQKFNLDDLLIVYKLDSNSLYTFSTERHFDLVHINEDNWIISFTYQSNIDSNISFIRTFPKDHSDKVFLYYYFNDEVDYKAFKDSLKVKKFHSLRNYEMFPNSPNMSDYREGYVKRNLELELSKTNYGKRRRSLLLYKRVN